MNSTRSCRPTSSMRCAQAGKRPQARLGWCAVEPQSTVQAAPTQAASGQCGGREAIRVAARGDSRGRFDALGRPEERSPSA